MRVALKALGSSVLLATSWQVSAMSDVSEISPSAASMNKEYFKKDYQHLSDEMFDAKWKSSLKTPLKFLRSYVKTWYREVATLEDRGPIGYCLGDAHPENFGFVWFGRKEIKYVFNDLDDPGLCPIASDALRYFTTLDLSQSDPDLFKTLLAMYGRVLNGAEESSSLPQRLFPSWETLNKGNAKYIKEGRFVFGKKIKPITEQEKKQVAKALKGKLYRKFKILDFASRTKKSGGSAGLKRYWVLVHKERSFSLKNLKRSYVDIMELKPLITPATFNDEWSKPLKDDFVKVSSREIYGKSEPTHFDSVAFAGTRYQLRSRTKGDLELDEYNKYEQYDILKAQVSLIAKHHAKYLNKNEKQEILKWINISLPVMVKRYTKAFENNKAPTSEIH